MGDLRRLVGRWRVNASRGADIDTGTILTLSAGDVGLCLSAPGTPSQVVPWSAVTADVDDGGTVMLDLGRGEAVALWPIDGADAQALLASVTEGRSSAIPGVAWPSPYRTLPAGPSRVLVVYRSADTGEELDPDALFAAVAEDAGLRAADGWTLASLVALPLRHSGQKLFADEGSGYQTKAALGGLYARS